MSTRRIPLVNGEFYHVFNHGIDYRDICLTQREYKRFLLTVWFYQPKSLQFKLSQYLTLARDAQQSLIKEINAKEKLIEIHAFSVMPNHFHLLVKQLVDKGISTFISNIQNSYSKYYNVKHDRKGSLFLSPFQAKHIYSEEQFIHVSRYIHLQRYSAGIIKDINDLLSDPYSSLPFYFQKSYAAHSTVYTSFLTNLFSNKNTHWEFIKDHADYQRSLEHIKHLLEF